jgi:hypothetical protein
MNEQIEVQQSEETMLIPYTVTNLTEHVAGIIYAQGKAKFLNILETQFENVHDPRLRACKRMVEDALEVVIHNVTGFIKDTLGDWKTEVEVAAECDLAPEELEEAKKEWAPVSEIMERQR